MYSQYGDGIEYYFELGYAVKGVISSGYDGWDYIRQYFIRIRNCILHLFLKAARNIVFILKMEK